MLSSRIGAVIALSWLLLNLATLSQPRSAGAQTYCGAQPGVSSATCADGASYQYCYQNGIQVVPAGQSCATTVAYSCNGVACASPINSGAAAAPCGSAAGAYLGLSCAAPMAAMTGTAPTTYAPSPATQGFPVSYSPGWNLVAGPSG